MIFEFPLNIEEIEILRILASIPPAIILAMTSLIFLYYYVGRYEVSLAEGHSDNMLDAQKKITVGLSMMVFAGAFYVFGLWLWSLMIIAAVIHVFYYVVKAVFIILA